MSLFLLLGYLALCMVFVGVGWLLTQMLNQQGRLLLHLEALEARANAPGPALPVGEGASSETGLNTRQLVPLLPPQARSSRQKVFGIGLSKTGTVSLTEALKLLRYRTLHYPADPMTQLEVYRFFATGEADIHLSVLNDHDALTDTPVCCLYQALDKAYPGSKFILTVREKQAWLRSYHEHRHRSSSGTMPSSLLIHYSHFIRERLYSTLGADPELLSQAYDRYIAEVLDYFKERPDDLLILDICGGEGWSKLAPFLGAPLPEMPFPWENRTPKQEEPDKGKRETGLPTDRAERKGAEIR